ncbi:MAG: hypothetical protein MHM6MM_002965 [Cercozoa sp. M6MM]
MPEQLVMTPEVQEELQKLMQQPLVKYSDMDNDLRAEATDIVVSAIDKFGEDSEAAAKTVKERMDRKFGPSWQCIIGKGFGFRIDKQVGYCLELFYMGDWCALVFK